MKLVRFGVSLPQELMKKFDRLVKRKRYPNRSEAIRDLIRRELVHEEIASDKNVAGVLSLLYDHHKSAIAEKLTALQHDHHQSIISNTHVHLDHDNCLEVILLHGRAKDIKKFADGIISIKGVKHGGLHLTSAGAGLD
ncbi:MAG: nickel-responsive transcriptional regulator NikR [Ignavibacteria bacterium]|nr:MAG: nickel-responsive transcriptional regulator NikR [Ignavibacteria bacterium]